MVKNIIKAAGYDKSLIVDVPDTNISLFAGETAPNNWDIWLGRQNRHKRINIANKASTKVVSGITSNLLRG